MFEIEYSLTLEDEINSLDAKKEYISQLPLWYWQNDYIIPILWLLINISSIYKCFTVNVPFYTGFEGISVFSTMFNLLLAILIMPQVNIRLPTKNLAKYNIRRFWLDNPAQVKPRKITVNDTEFIFSKTKTYMFLSEEKVKSYKWQELRKYLESDRGFFLDFAKWNQFNREPNLLFIPRRIFTNIEQIDKLRKLLDRSKS